MGPCWAIITLSNHCDPAGRVDSGVLGLCGRLAPWAETLCLEAGSPLVAEENSRRQTQRAKLGSSGSFPECVTRTALCGGEELPGAPENAPSAQSEGSQSQTLCLLHSGDSPTPPHPFPQDGSPTPDSQHGPLCPPLRSLHTCGVQM